MRGLRALVSRPREDTDSLKGVREDMPCSLFYHSEVDMFSIQKGTMAVSPLS